MPRLSSWSAASVALATLLLATACGPDPIAPRPPALAPILTGNASVPAAVTEQIRTLVMQHPDFKLSAIERLDVRQPFADAPKVYSFEGIGKPAEGQSLPYYFLGNWTQGSETPSLTVRVASQPGLPAAKAVSEDVVGRIAGRLITHPGKVVTIEGLDSVPLDVSAPIGVTAFTSRITVDGRPTLAQGYYRSDTTFYIILTNL